MASQPNTPTQIIDIKNYLVNDKTMTNDNLLRLRQYCCSLPYKFILFFRPYLHCRNIDIKQVLTNNINDIWKYRDHLYECSWFYVYIRPVFDIDKVTFSIEEAIQRVLKIMNDIYGSNVEYLVQLGWRIKIEDNKETKSYRIVIWNVKVYAANFFNDIKEYCEKNNIDYIDKSIYGFKRILRGVFSYKNKFGYKKEANTRYNFHNFEYTEEEFRKSLVFAPDDNVPDITNRPCDPIIIPKTKRARKHYYKTINNEILTDVSQEIIKIANQLKVKICKWFRSCLNIQVYSIDINYHVKYISFLIPSDCRSRSNKTPCICKKTGCVIQGTTSINYWFDTGDITIRFLNGCNQTININIAPHLKAEKFTSDAIKYKRDLYKDYPHIEVNDDNVNFDLENCNLFAMYGYCGYGKTSKILQVISTINYNRCLIITDRILQNMDMMGSIIRHFDAKRITDFHYETDEVTIVAVIHSAGAKIFNYNLHPKKLIVVLNSKSLTKSIKANFDIVFCDEFTQDLKSIVDPNDTHTYEITSHLFYIIKNSKYTFTSDVIFHPSIGGIYNQCNKIVQHFNINTTHMNFKNMLLTNDIDKLIEVLKDDRPKYIHCDSRRFIEHIFPILVKHFDGQKVVKIVGKSAKESVQAQIDNYKEILPTLTDAKIVIASPAITGAISIYGKRIIIGIRFYSNILSNYNFINSLLRAREADTLLLFVFASQQNRYQMPIALTDPLHASILHFRNNIGIMSLKECLYQFIRLLDDAIFEEYYVQYEEGIYKYFEEKIGYKFEMCNDPKIQFWRSSRWGMKSVHPQAFKEIFTKINEITDKMEVYNVKHENINSIFKFVFSTGPSFEYNIYTIFENADIVYQMRYDEFEVDDDGNPIYDNELKKAIEFFNKFHDAVYNPTPGADENVEDVKKLMRRRANDYIANIGNDKKIYTVNQTVANYQMQLHNFKQQFDKLANDKSKDNIEAMKDICLKAYYLGNNGDDAIFGKNHISIEHHINGKVYILKQLTDHYSDFVKSLTKDEYSHEEINAFTREQRNQIGSLIHYHKFERQLGLRGNRKREYRLLKLCHYHLKLILK